LRAVDLDVRSGGSSGTWIQLRIAGGMNTGKHRISYEDFLITALRDCRTVSRTARPTEGEVAYEYDCRLEEFVRKPIYSARFVDDTRTQFRNYDNPEARAIRIEELARLSPLVRSQLEKWSTRDVTEISVITLHCTGCQRRVLIDGVQRTVLLLSRGETSALVHVTELSGARWPIGTPDLDVVCTCHRSVR
jgi:hypothetical protein